MMLMNIGGLEKKIKISDMGFYHNGIIRSWLHYNHNKERHLHQPLLFFIMGRDQKCYSIVAVMDNHTLYRKQRTGYGYYPGRLSNEYDR